MLLTRTEKEAEKQKAIEVKGLKPQKRSIKCFTGYKIE